MSKSYSIADARRNLPSLVREVERGETVEFTRRGKPVAVLLSKNNYAVLSGTGKDLWSAIQEFRSQVDLGELQIDEVFRDVRDQSPGRDFEL